MANYENLKVFHVFEKKKLELDENYEDLILKKQVTFIDAFRPGSMYLDHWSWVCLDAMKYFYETGVFVETGSDYLDGQNEAVISGIVEAQGKSWNEVKIIHEPHRTA